MEDFPYHYATQLHRHFKLYVNWTPFNHVQLGDIGLLDKDVLFDRKDSLQNAFGISLPQRESDTQEFGAGTHNHLSFSTENSTEVEFIAKGQAGMANGGIEVRFKGRNAFFFNLVGIRIVEIDRQLSLAKNIMALYKQGQWDYNWVVVTAFLEATTSTILGSRNGRNAIKLEANINMPVIDLSDTRLSFNLTSAQSLDLEVISQKKLRPLLKISKIRRKGWLGEKSFGFSEEALPDSEELKKHILDSDGDMDDFFEFAELN